MVWLNISVNKFLILTKPQWNSTMNNKYKRINPVLVFNPLSIRYICSNVNDYVMCKN